MRNSKRWRRKLLDELNGLASTPTETAWADAIDEYVQHCSNLTRMHQQQIDAVLCAYRDIARPRTLADCTPSSCEEYMASLDHLASDTQRSRFAKLAAYFNFCVRRGWLDRSPLVSVTKPKRVHRIKQAPTADEWVRLLKATSSVITPDRQGWYVLVLLAVVTGLRQSALLSIRLQDITLGDSDTDGVGLLKSFTPKTKKEKLHGLPAIVCDKLAVRISSLPDGADRLFGWGRWQRKAWDRLKKVAGVTFSFHSLRASSGQAAALARLRAAGAAHLDHYSSDVFQTHYESAAQTARAVAANLLLPDLPAMPPYASSATRS